MYILNLSPCYSAAVGVGTGTDVGAAGIDTEAVSTGIEAAAGEDDTAQGVVIAGEMNVPDTVVPGEKL